MKTPSAILCALTWACTPGETELVGDDGTVGSVLDDDTGGGSSDSGSDTGEVAAEGSEFNGEYQGWYTMVVKLGELSDTCEGQAWVTMDVEADPQLTGDSSCEFHGLAAKYLELRDTYLGEISGSLSDSPGVEGELATDMGAGGVFSVAWQGVFNNDTLTGEFDGSTSVNVEGTEYEINFNGDFSVMR